MTSVEGEIVMPVSRRVITDETNEYRKKLLAMGRKVARQICALKGEVHSREVREVLAKKGMFTMVSIGDQWLGLLFREKGWTFTGKYHVYKDPRRNIHGGHVVKIWTWAPEKAA